MNFSYSAAWDETVRLIRSHLSLFVAIMGVFIFLPNLLLGHFAPYESGTAATPAALWNAYQDYIAANWHWLMLVALANMVGALAILLLICDRDQPTVASAIGGAVKLLPFYFVASLLCGVILAISALAFLVPAIYFYGRLAPLPAVMVAEGERNPLAAIKRCFEITKGRAWAVAGLLVLIWIAGILVTGAAGAVLGIVLLLVLGPAIGQFLILIVSTALSAILAMVLVVVKAAIFEQLTAIRSSRALD